LITRCFVNESNYPKCRPAGLWHADELLKR
jgi:hypothetical protein